MTFEELGIKNDMPRGWIRSSEVNRRIKNMWRNMWLRCKDTSHSMHKYYKDCTICDEWKFLSNYVKFIESEPRYLEFCSNPVSWCIDKDSIVPNNKHYCPEFCFLMTRSENSKEVRRRCPCKTPKKPIIGIGDSIIVFDSVNDAKDLGFNPCNIVNCLKGRYNSHHGYKWYYLEVIEL